MGSVRQTVLIVEDDALLRMDALDLLSEAGFGTAKAKSADKAIAILEVRTDITIVFTDVDMPGSINGMKLAQAIRGRWPPIKIIAASGVHKLNARELPPGSLFLAKPYSAREFCVREDEHAAPPCGLLCDI